MADHEQLTLLTPTADSLTVSGPSRLDLRRAGCGTKLHYKLDITLPDSGRSQKAMTGR